MANTTHAIGFGMGNRFALYIEGELCPFKQIDRYREAGSVASLIVSLPATRYVRKIRNRSRVHLLFRDHRNIWVVLFEGEVVAKGFTKGVQNREYQLVVTHVAGLLDQFAISAIDPAAMPEAMMTGRLETGESGFSSAGATALKGSILELLRPEQVKSELPNVKDMAFTDWVDGAFRRFLRIIRTSRIADAYMNKAVVFHRLNERLAVPETGMMRWETFFDLILQNVFIQGAQYVGDRQTFFELVRSIVTNFLWEVTVEPSAASVRHQIQVKPITTFHPVPRCNILYPSLVKSYGYQEDPSQKPTRTEAHMAPAPALSGIDSNPAIYRSLTVFAPAELQWKWFHLRETNEQMFNANLDVQTALDKLEKPMPQFLTREEEERGIIANYFDMPPALNDALMSANMVSGSDYQSTGIEASGMTPDEIQGVSQDALTSDDPKKMLIKYRALAALALGDGGGLNAATFIKGKALMFPFRKLNVPGGIYLLSDSDYTSHASNRDFMPRRIVFMKTMLPVVFHNNQITNLKDLIQKTGANYVIAKNGAIIQTRRRNINTFDEPRAIPVGLKVNPVELTAEEVASLNRGMPNLGGTAKGKTDAGLVISGKTKTKVGVGGYSAVIDLSDFINTKLDSTYAADVLTARIAPGKSKVYLTPPGGMEYALDITSVEGTAPNLKITLSEAHIPIGNLMDTRFIIKSVENLTGDPYQPFWLTREDPKLKTNKLSLQAWTRHDLEVKGKNGTGFRMELEQGRVSGVFAGNFESVVVAFEGPSSKPNSWQLEAAYYLAAAITEMGTGDATAAPTPVVAGGSWAKDRHLKEIESLSSYFPNHPMGVELGGDFVAKVNRMRTLLYNDFKTIDKALKEGGSSFSAPIAAVAAAGSDTTPPPAAATEEAATEEASETEIDIETYHRTINDIFKVVKDYAAPLVNFQHYWARFSGQSTSIPGVFNPYPAVAYPCLMPDDSEAREHLVGYLHAVQDSISGDGQAITSYTVTHIRPFKDESILPFRKQTNQTLPIRWMREFANPETRGKVPADERKQLEKLGATSLLTHLPIELYGIGPEREDRNPVPFIFDGGFGFKNKRPDFSQYANYIGVGGENGANWYNALVFRDDIIAGRDEDGFVKTFYSAPDAFQQANGVYRPIQPVGDPKKSFIAFDAKKEDLERVMKDPGSKPPQKIKLEIVDAAKPSERKPMPWAEDIQQAIAEHRRILDLHIGQQG